MDGSAVEVSLADSHASIEIRSEKKQRQLLELVKGLQRVGLSVLHLNANTVEGTAVYSLSVKVISYNFSSDQQEHICFRCRSYFRR